MENKPNAAEKCNEVGWIWRKNLPTEESDLKIHCGRVSEASATLSSLPAPARRRSIPKPRFSPPQLTVWRCCACER